MATRRREVIWSRRARDGLDEAVAYIAKDSQERARDFLERALNTAESLDQFAERGRIVPELDDPYVRELFVYRYRLVYEVSDSKATILGFLHGARDFNRWWRGE
jgi:toxin ParE1/3/4